MKNLTGIITGVLIIVFIGFSICQNCCGTEEACAAEENTEEVVEENTEEVAEENTEEAEATDSTNTDTSAVVEESTEE